MLNRNVLHAAENQLSTVQKAFIFCFDSSIFRKAIMKKSTTTIVWCYGQGTGRGGDKSVTIPMRILLDESRHIKAILSHDTHPSAITALVKSPISFERWILPILQNDNLIWKDIGPIPDNWMCQLLQMADFLVMDELLVELHKRFLERAPSVLSAASFNPENMSKYQIWTLMGHDHDKYFKLRLVLEWLKGSTSENRNAMKLWFEDKLGRSWVSLI